MGTKLSSNKKIAIMAILVFSCICASIYFQIIGMGEVYTHLFYIPISIACIWWPGKGLIVPGLLSVAIITLHLIFRQEVSIFNDLIRSLSFVIVGLFVSLVGRLEKELENKCKELKTSYHGLQIKNKKLSEQEKEIAKLKNKKNI